MIAAQLLLHHYHIPGILSYHYDISSNFIYPSPNVLSYLSDWLEIPRASLHVTLGP